MDLKKLKEISKDIDKHIDFNIFDFFMLFILLFFFNIVLIFLFVIFLSMANYTILTWLDLNWFTYVYSKESGWTTLFYQLFVLISSILTPTALGFALDVDESNFFKKAISMYYLKLFYVDKPIFFIKSIKTKKTNRRRIKKLMKLRTCFENLDEKELFNLYKSLKPSEINRDLLDIIEEAIEKKLEINSSITRVKNYQRMVNKKTLRVEEMINE